MCFGVLERESKNCTSWRSFNYRSAHFNITTNRTPRGTEGIITLNGTKLTGRKAVGRDENVKLFLSIWLTAGVVSLANNGNETTTNIRCVYVRRKWIICRWSIDEPGSDRTASRVMVARRTAMFVYDFILFRFFLLFISLLLLLLFFWYFIFFAPLFGLAGINNVA